jgi:hypothetical protein
MQVYWGYFSRHLSDWLNNATPRNQAAHRASILIIDDYSNFHYRKSDGSQGGYLELLWELNTSRRARHHPCYRNRLKASRVGGVLVSKGVMIADI